MREIYNIETDIAIIGGGTAGLNAAMAAAESGLKVLVAEKASQATMNPTRVASLSWVAKLLRVL